MAIRILKKFDHRLFSLTPNTETIKLSNPDLDFESLSTEYEKHITEFGFEKRFFFIVWEKYQQKGAR